MTAQSAKQSIREIAGAPLGPRTYVVRAVNVGGTCNLEAPPGSSYAPLLEVPQWLGETRATPAVGSECTVIFRDGDRRRPAIVAFAPPATVAPVARLGDACGRLFFETITKTLYYSTSTAAPYAWVPVATGVIAPTIADAGTEVTITEGSALVGAA